MKRSLLDILGVLAMLTATASPAAKPDSVTYFVATNGSDVWSGKLPAPNATKTDGPFASIVRARDAIRALKKAPGRADQAITVQVRAGTYYISQAITLTPEDSGAPARPTRYMAYPGEKPVLCGGRRITGWQRHKGSIYVADLPEVKDGHWYFRQLFVDGRRQVRARFPNVDPVEPFRKGFLYVETNGFGMCVGCIHNRGDWMKYKVEVPADGQYGFWLYYAAQNKPHGNTDMAGRTTVSIDDGPGVPLMNLPDTGSWHTLKWARSATLALTKGTHVLQWQNIEGGGLNLDAYAICDDPEWTPQGTELAAPAPGRHLVVIQAEQFTASYGPQLRVAGAGGSKTLIACKPGTPKQAWADAPDAEIHVFQSGSCRAFKQIVKIQSTDSEDATIRVTGKECIAALRTGDRYFVENVFEELDSPGEWYLDREAGRLYYWPTDGEPEQSRVVAPVVGRIFELLGDAKSGAPVKHVTISGFAMQETDYSPQDGCAGYGMGCEGTVYLRAAADCSVDDNRFVNVGKYGICSVESTRNRFTGNVIEQSAEGGILLLDSSRHNVSNNYIHHIGAVYKHVGGVVLQGKGSSDNVVANNLIHDSSRYGVTLKNPGGKNVIEYNEMYDLNLETYDTGGIEVTQHDREFRSGSVIRSNVVHDVGGYSSIFDKPTFLSWGIYLDSYAGGYEVRDNIVYRNSHGGLMIQGGKDNYVHNNIFVGSTLRQMQLNNFRSNSTGNRVVRNVVCYSAPDALLMVAYRPAQEVWQVDSNLYFHTAGKPLLVQTAGGNPIPFAAWQQNGFDVHSLVAAPLFVDPAKDNYALRPESPALKLGFKPIETTRIGLRQGARAARGAE